MRTRTPVLSVSPTFILKLLATTPKYTPDSELEKFYALASTPILIDAALSPIVRYAHHVVWSARMLQENIAPADLEDALREIHSALEDYNSIAQMLHHPAIKFDEAITFAHGVVTRDLQNIARKKSYALSKLALEELQRRARSMVQGTDNTCEVVNGVVSDKFGNG
ncbi:hypothetical protein SAMN05445504_7779 [Burkholderia sp. CF099]|nr:hypothetical protein SAMN05445504_7779 [Burkholderia sp. CF099]